MRYFGVHIAVDENWQFGKDYPGGIHCICGTIYDYHRRIWHSIVWDYEGGQCQRDTSYKISYSYGAKNVTVFKALGNSEDHWRKAVIRSNGIIKMKYFEDGLGSRDIEKFEEINERLFKRYVMLSKNGFLVPKRKIVESMNKGLFETTGFNDEVFEYIRLIESSEDYPPF